ncbi:MAG: hypothetical protein KAU22_12735 [Desulfuromonadales bacterium]|nr:hypothetical protein [Desulfuromonadales bacterium]
MRKFMFHNMAFIMLVFVLSVLFCAPNVYADGESQEEEEELLQARPNPMEHLTNSSKLQTTGQRAGMVNRANAAGQTRMIGAKQGQVGAVKQIQHRNQGKLRVGAKGIMNGPSRTSRNQQLSTSGHKQDKQGTEDLERPNPLSSLSGQTRSISPGLGGPAGGHGPVNPAAAQQ